MANDDLQVLTADVDRAFALVQRTANAPRQQLRIGEQCRIHVSGKPGWHVVLLWRDADGFHLLAPSRDLPEDTVADSGEFLLPETPDVFEIVRPLGRKTVLAILRKDPWNPLFHKELTGSGLFDRSLLRGIGGKVRSDPPENRCVLVQEFEVVETRTPPFSA